MESIFYLSVFLGAAALGLGVVFLLLKTIWRLPVTDAKAGHIADAIRIGAMTFLREEYKIICIIVGALASLCRLWLISHSARLLLCFRLNFLHGRWVYWYECSN